MTIPRLFHVVWLSEEKEKFDKAQITYFYSWLKHNPDFEIVIWDKYNCGIPDIEEFIKTKKYANISNYLRLKVVYEYGGIYLDDDTKVLKSFNPLIANEIGCFFGIDHAYETKVVVNNAVIGAPPKNKFIEKCYLEWREKFNYTSDAILSGPYHITNHLPKLKPWKQGSPLFQKVEDITIYSGDVFYGLYGSNSITDRSISVHQYRLSHYNQ